MNSYINNKNNSKSRKKRSYEQMNVGIDMAKDRNLQTETMDMVTVSENLKKASENCKYLTLNDVIRERSSSQDETSSVYSNISVIRYIGPSKHEVRRNVQNRAPRSNTLRIMNPETAARNPFLSNISMGTDSSWQSNFIKKN